MTRITVTRTPDVEDDIIQSLSQGVPLRQICKRLGCSRTSVHRWMADDAELAKRYAKARQEGFDAIAEEILDIADDGTNDWIERERDGASYAELNHEHVQRSKLRVDARLKLLAKWYPAKYGERVAVEHDVAEGLAERLARARRAVGGK